MQGRGAVGVAQRVGERVAVREACRQGSHEDVARAVRLRALDRVRAHYHVSIAEVGEQDVWQRASVGFAIVTNDRQHANSLVDQVTRTIGGARDCLIQDRAVEILSLGSTIRDLHPANQVNDEPEELP